MADQLKHSQKIKETIIIVGPMPFPWKLVKAALKDHTSQLIFVDGGLVHFLKFKKLAPALTESALKLGDGDSSKEVMSIKKTNQNLSDLAFTLTKLRRNNNIGRYLFVGFLGGRLDHELFNLGEIAQFVKKLGKNPNQVRTCLDDKVEFLSPGKHLLAIQGIFSLASLEDNQVLIKGYCLYKTKTWIKLPAFSSRGLSNQATGQVEIQNKKILMVLFNRN